ncbi:hypothetical protein QNA23_11140 [Rhodococcus erythropolis]|uniref:hypothetical protein n=1 Tax=Rhodococcus erythropolis TaxID=1833 RepID=UPI0024B8B3EB|nr:hypothetical protein [Rhodococcus erythropolis]MDJ0404037.1 hypothetical protein [Rhodococcus erythropolis]
MLDFFRHVLPWTKLYRLLERLPPESHYKAARAMDPELAEMILNRPASEGPPPRLSPQGYSHGIYLQMMTVEAIRSLDYTLKAVNGNKPAYPTMLERPKTAAQILDLERDRVEVDRVLGLLGLNNN